MKNLSLKTKLVIILAMVILFSSAGFTFNMYKSARGLALKYALTEAQNKIDDSLHSLMETSEKCHQDVQKAQAAGAEGNRGIVQDWSRMKTAFADITSRRDAEDAASVRLIGDKDIFGVQPLGSTGRTGIATTFEREAAARIRNGKSRVEAVEDGVVRIAVPLESRAHAGCAVCHQAAVQTAGGLKHNGLLGMLIVSVPTGKISAGLHSYASIIAGNLIGMLVIVGAILYFCLNRAVTGPIEKAVVLIRQIAQGDLSGRLDFKQRDEVGMLAESMNAMVANMRMLSQAAEKISTGDLGADFSVLSDRDMLGHALKRMAEKLSQLIAEIHMSASSVLSGAEQLSSSSQAVSRGATEQASALEEISSSMNEIAAQARQNSENAMLASKLAGDSRQSAEKGDRQTMDMSGVMHKISEASSNISKIIKIIDDIAFQTNLLALNAAVEAARAGSRGKGFAVVAEEVRTLASRSAQAAKDTEQMIEQAVQSITEGTSMADSMTAALHDIVAASGKVTELVAEIAAASHEQAQGVAQITTGLGQIDQVTQQNTAHAEESASAAEELTGQAQVLEQMVATFKVKKGLIGARPLARLEQPGRQPMLNAGARQKRGTGAVRLAAPWAEVEES